MTNKRRGRGGVLPKRSQKLILTGVKITYGYWPSKMTGR